MKTPAEQEAAVLREVSLRRLDHMKTLEDAVYLALLNTAGPDDSVIVQRALARWQEEREWRRNNYALEYRGPRGPFPEWPAPEPTWAIPEWWEK